MFWIGADDHQDLFFGFAALSHLGASDDLAPVAHFFN